MNIIKQKPFCRVSFKKALKGDFSSTIDIYDSLFEYTSTTSALHSADWEFLGNGIVVDVKTSKAKGMFFSITSASWEPTKREDNFCLLFTEKFEVFRLSSDAELIFWGSSQSQVLNYLELILLPHPNQDSFDSKQYQLELYLPFYRELKELLPVDGQKLLSSFIPLNFGKKFLELHNKHNISWLSSAGVQAEIYFGKLPDFKKLARIAGKPPETIQGNYFKSFGFMDELVKAQSELHKKISLKNLLDKDLYLEGDFLSFSPNDTTFELLSELKLCAEQVLLKVPLSIDPEWFKLYLESLGGRRVLAQLKSTLKSSENSSTEIKLFLPSIKKQLKFLIEYKASINRLEDYYIRKSIELRFAHKGSDLNKLNDVLNSSLLRIETAPVVSERVE